MSQAAPAPRRGGWTRRRAAIAAAAAGALALVALLAAALLARAPGAVAAYASARLHRRVEIAGGAGVRFTPGGPEVTFRRARIGRPAWAGPGDALSVASGKARFSWFSILHLRPVAESLELDGAVVRMTRDAQGRPDWAAGPGASALSQPLVVKRLTLRDGRLLYLDASSGVRLEGAVSADPDAPDGLGLHVDGQGAAQAGPWRVDFRAPATGIGARRPLPLRLQLAQGASRLAFSGELPPGLDAAHVRGEVSGSGPDLHDLARLLRIPFPHTAPYRLSARLERADTAFHLIDLKGRTGTSDLTGALTVTQTKGGRRLDGTFVSPDLDLGDLLVVASAGQAGTGHAPHKGGRLIPDVSVNAAPLRPLTGAVSLEAPRVRPTGGIAVRALSLKVLFDHGRVSAAPLATVLPRGRAVWRLELDARRATPAVALDLALDDASTVDLLGPAAAKSPIRARLDGRVSLRGAGRTLHDAAAAASGSVSLRSRGGSMGRTDAQVLGGDLSGAFASLLSHDKGALPLRCLAADFTAAHGRLQSRRLVFATAAGRVTGSGEVDLGRETLDLSLRGEPAHPGIVKAHSYVRVSGPLAHPRAELRTGGLGGVIGTLLSVVPLPGQAITPVC